jgi:hypothetical protein
MPAADDDRWHERHRSSHKLGYGRRRLMQQVEDRALPWIVCGDFDESAGHPCDGRRVVEEDDARILRTDTNALQAGLGIHHELGFDRNVERCQQRLQVTARLLERQPLAAPQPPVQLLDGTGGHGVPISDRRMIDVERLELAIRHGGHPARQLEGEQRNEHGTLHLCRGVRRLSMKVEGSDMLTSSQRDFMSTRGR